MTVRDNNLSIDQICSTVMRALSEDRDAEVSIQYNNHTDPDLQGKTLVIPKGAVTKQTNLQRSFVDSAALRIKYHQDPIHQQYRPEGKESRQVFDEMEWLRTSLIGAAAYPGIRHNMGEHLIYQVEKTLEDENPPIGKLLSLWASQQLANIALPADVQALVDQHIGAMRFKLDEKVKDLNQLLDQQEQYAKKVIEILQLWEGGNVEQEPAQDDVQQDSDQEGEEDKHQEEQKQKAESQSDNASSREQTSSGEESTRDTKSQVKGEVQASEYRTLSNHEIPEEYRVYTETHDQIIEAGQLASYEELKRLRWQLDEKLEGLKEATRKDMNQFIRELMASQKLAWDYHLDDGLLDAKRLAQRVADKHYEYIYKQRKEASHANTVVSLLLDNSGSMRGRPIAVAAMSAEILTQALELCGIKVEILGFTTVEWKGGKSRKQWEDEGSVSNPGRLNDLRHIIYKPASSSWRRSRKNLGLMLKEGILKENIDGEAIMWACRRLSCRPEERKVLMVISDGAPVDDSTLSANNDGYLDRHLRQIIHTVENKTDIELLAIGIGHDVNRYYQRAVTIRNVEQLSQTMFKELSALLS